MSCGAKPGPSGTSLFSAKAGRMTDSIKAPKPSRHLRSPRRCGWGFLAPSPLPPVYQLPTGHSHSTSSSFSHMPRLGGEVHFRGCSTQPRDGKEVASLQLWLPSNLCIIRLLPSVLRKLRYLFGFLSARAGCVVEELVSALGRRYFRVGLETWAKLKDRGPSVPVQLLQAWHWWPPPQSLWRKQ